MLTLIDNLHWKTVDFLFPRFESSGADFQMKTEESLFFVKIVIVFDLQI